MRGWSFFVYMCVYLGQCLRRKYFLALFWIRFHFQGLFLLCQIFCSDLGNFVLM